MLYYITLYSHQSRNSRARATPIPAPEPAPHPLPPLPDPAKMIASPEDCKYEHVENYAMKIVGHCVHWSSHQREELCIVLSLQVPTFMMSHTVPESYATI